MRLDYSINLNRPQADPDITTNGDMILDMQSGLQNDIGNDLQQQQQTSSNMPSAQPIQPVQPGQRNVMPK